MTNPLRFPNCKLHKVNAKMKGVINQGHIQHTAFVNC